MGERVHVMVRVCWPKSRIWKCECECLPPLSLYLSSSSLLPFHVPPLSLRYFSARPFISTSTSPMSAYPPMDPYRRSRFEHGIDAKVVVMGNSGSSYFLRSLSLTHNIFKVLARPASFNDTPKTSSTQRTPLPPPAHSSSQRR